MSFKSLFLVLPFLAILASCFPLTGSAQDDKSKSSQPLKVFLLVGQSNMQGHARPHTLAHVNLDAKTKPIFETLVNKDNSPKTFDKVWINSLNSGKTKVGNLTVGFGADDEKIGPELAFGAYMQQMVNEPILIVKTAWGGKSINTDFRPPSAGQYVFRDNQIERFKKREKDIEQLKAKKKEATGKYYRLMIEHTKTVLADIKSTYPDYDAENGYELAGLVWFQGWNDMVDSGFYPDRGKSGGYDEYSKLLAHFIRDVRKDLNAPELPFVIGVLGVGGPTDKYGKDQERIKSTHQNFRDAMAAPANLPEFKGNVAAVLTENSWDLELTALQSRREKIQNEVRKAKKEQQLEPEALKELRKKLEKEEFSKEELAIIEKGISNQAYHYLGSAKIMTQIGKSFAEAMHELQK